MKSYKEMDKNELLSVKAALEEKYKEEQAKGLKLNMARGKPGEPYSETIPETMAISTESANADD